MTTLGAVLKLVLPKGSLEKATLELFDAADLTVRRSSEVEALRAVARWVTRSRTNAIN